MTFSTSIKSEKTICIKNALSHISSKKTRISYLPSKCSANFSKTVTEATIRIFFPCLIFGSTIVVQKVLIFGSISTARSVFYKKHKFQNKIQS